VPIIFKAQVDECSMAFSVGLFNVFKLLWANSVLRALVTLGVLAIFWIKVRGKTCRLLPSRAKFIPVFG